MASGYTSSVMQVEGISLDGWRFEHELRAEGHRAVAGVDEAGRGPLAGPVVAAAVVLPAEWPKLGLPRPLQGLTDSKQLKAEQRTAFFEALVTHPEIRYGVGQVDVEVIDAINILQATHQAMRAALSQLNPPPAHILVDGRPVHSLPYPQTPLVQGDARSYSIAAASILAKVTRDRLMEAYDREYPDYGFANHKVYATPRHLQALRELGPCPLHRKSFSPVRLQTAPLF